MRKLTAAVVAVTVLALTGCGGGSAVQGKPAVTGATPANGSSSSSATTTTSVTPKATTSVTPKAQHPEDATASANRIRGDAASGVKGVTTTPKSVSGPSATLRLTCSNVEKAVSGLSGKSSPPTATQLGAALAQVKLLNGAGDTETRNALSGLLKALPRYRDEDPTRVANDGRRAFLDSLAKLADRCKAAGSSALQWVG